MCKNSASTSNIWKLDDALSALYSAPVKRVLLNVLVHCMEGSSELSERVTLVEITLTLILYTLSTRIHFGLRIHKSNFENNNLWFFIF